MAYNVLRGLQALLVAAGLTVWAMPAAASSGWSDSATVAVYAEVIQPLQVEAVEPLVFGAIQGGETDGSVLITPEGEQFVMGGAMSIESLAGGQTSPPPAAGRYEVIGEANRAYRVTTPSSIVVAGAQLDSEQASVSLIARDFVVRTQSMPDAGNMGRLDAFGRDGFWLGGTVDVPAFLMAGIYEVRVPVTVDYA